MHIREHDRDLEERDEQERRDELEDDPHHELMRELDLAERIAERASLPPTDPLPLAAARHQLGSGPSPYKHTHDPERQRAAAGDGVRDDARCDDVRARHVECTPEREGIAEVCFDRCGVTPVAAHELEREAG